jgi:YggT family protein
MTVRAILAYSIHLLFLSYTVLLFLRIISSWFSHNFRYHRFVHFLAFYTDPYLNFFRKLIPPLGGVLDLSPILAFFVLQILEKLLLGMVQ